MKNQLSTLTAFALLWLPHLAFCVTGGLSLTSVTGPSADSYKAVQAWSFRGTMSAAGTASDVAGNTAPASSASITFAVPPGGSPLQALEAYLKPGAVGATQAYDQFGSSVAISGDTAVVGAPFESSSTTGVNSTPDEHTTGAGAAYVFVRRGGVWTQQAYLKASNAGAGDQFGFSVSVSGDTVVVGAPIEDSSTTGVNSTPDENAGSAGAAYVFVRSGTTWTQQAYLKASNAGVGGGSFGRSVSVSGDTVVVGAYGENSSTTGVNSTPNENSYFAGAAYVFMRSGTTWTQQAYLKASNAGAGDFFGLSVAVAGDTVVVGAAYENSSTTGVDSTPDENANRAGAAYVFVRSGTTWSQQAYLKAGNSGADGLFGYSVAVAGDTVVVGAIWEDSSTTGVNSEPNESAPFAGAAYVFVRSGTTWTQQAYLKASNTGRNDYFGGSVAISGETVVVGAVGESSSTTAVNSTPNESAPFAGAAYVFVRSGTTWSQQAYLKARPVSASDAFGASVSVSGGTVVVGAASEDSSTTGVNSTPNENATSAGAAYIFSVNDAPVAVNDSYTVSQGDVLTVTAAGVLANDTDIENDTLTATRLTDAAQGPVVLTANGAFSYTPNTNFYGPDSFTYRASDYGSNSNPATVSILVYARPTNAVPIAQTVFSGATLRFSATNLPVANAIRVGDPDSTTLTVLLAVTNGTVTVSNLTGVTFFENRTNGTNVVLTGLTADVNNALESLAYASKVNFFGDETLHIVTIDEGGRTNRGNGTVSILVEIPTLGGVPKVSLESLNDPMTGRMITNVTGLIMDTNLVQGVSFDSVSNVVNVLPVGGQDGSTNRSTITVRVQFNDGTTRDVVVPVIIYQPLLAATTNAGGTYDSTFGTPLFNYQNSLYEQKVRVQNNTPFDFTAVRITATNLPATVTLQNATVTNGGQVYIDYNLPILSGSNVTLKLEYFSSDLRTFTPGLKLELLNTTRTNTAPPGAVMTSVAAKTGYAPDGLVKNYLYFPSTAGQRYYVQYFDTVTVPQVWKTSGVVIQGTGLDIHWMDDGPPSTETPPGPLRFYRVVTDR